ncbi:MAG: CDP-diacylglycerol--serine O-phosphatidyltransferase, partial [Bacteroidota bacterium]
VAPGMILFQLLRISFARDPQGLDIPEYWLMPVFILPMAAAWRLARFNIDPGQAYGFKGMPTPAVGLLVASIPLILLYDTDGMLQQWILKPWILYGLTVLLSWLMVSDFPLMGLKFKDFGFRSNVPKWLLAGIAIISGIILQWLAVPVVFLAYIILSLVFKNKLHDV